MSNADFSNIRSLLHRSEWDQDMFLALRDSCLVFRKDHPQTWMAQVVPYLASFQDKWDRHLIRCSGGVALRDWTALLPCAWFEHMTSYPDLFSSHRIRSIHVSRHARIQGCHIFPDYFKWIPNIRHVHFKVPVRSSLTEMIERCSPCTSFVTHLHLANCNLTNEDFEELERMGLLNNLTFLDVSGNMELTSIPSNVRKNLKELHVEGSKVPPL